jgi:hypothetical protein
MSALAKLLAAFAGRGSQSLARVFPADERRILQNITKNAKEMVNRAGQADTGFTFDPRRGAFLEPGQQAGSMMSSVPNLPGQTSGLGTAVTEQDVIKLLSDPAALRRFQRGEYVGAWNPGGTGIGLDPSQRFLTRAGALRSGMRTNQMGGFDLLSETPYDVTPAEYEAALNLLANRLATGGAGAVGVAGLMNGMRNE